MYVGLKIKKSNKKSAKLEPSSEIDTMSMSQGLHNPLSSVE